MPDWQEVVVQHAPVIWRTVSRLVPPEEAARVFTETFMASRFDARRDSVADWSIMLQRVATSKAIAARKAMPRTGGPADLSELLRRTLTELPDQQAMLYSLRYLSGFTFNEIAMELAVPLDSVGRLTHDACNWLGARLIEQSQVREDGEARFAHQAADDLLEQATGELREAASPEMPPDLSRKTVEALIAAGPEPSYEKPLPKSPLVPAIALCVFVVLAAIAIAVYITKRPRPPAFAFDKVAAAVQPMESAGYQLTRTVRLPGANPRTVISRILLADGGHLRQTMERGNPIIIWDLEHGKTLTIDAARNRATMRDAGDMPEEYRPANPLTVLKGLPESAARPAEQTSVDGRPAQAFSFELGKDRLHVWADIDTRLPSLVEVISGDTTTLFSDFEWAPKIEPAQLALEAPSGYQLEGMKINLKQATERDLIEALRVAATLNGGRFPDEFDRAGMAKLLASLRARLPVDTTSPEYKEATADLEHDILQLGRGWMFIADPDNGEDWRYAGAGVYMGSDAPVLWYRPAKSRLYNVIDASLVVRPTRTDRLPNVPATQMIGPTTRRQTLP